MSNMRPSRKRVYESGATKRKKKELAEVEIRKQIYQKIYACMQIYMYMYKYTYSTVHAVHAKKIFC